MTTEELLSRLRAWPLGSYAPGKYTCKCVKCLAEFEGDKRAVHCLECAAIFIKTRIESLEARLKEAESALLPFAEFAEGIAASNPGWDHDEFTVFIGDHPLRLAPFRRARAFFKEQG